MKIQLANIQVDDQDKALQFYTQKLGFVKQHDIPMGGQYRWVTVTSPEGVDGVELVLEPLAFPPAQTYQKGLSRQASPPRHLCPQTSTPNTNASKILALYFAVNRLP